MRVCSIEGCGRRYFGNGYCGAHYQRARDKKDMSAPIKERITQPKVCSVLGCGERHCSKGFCSYHYNQKRYNEDPEEFRRKSRESSARYPQRIKDTNYKNSRGSGRFSLVKSQAKRRGLDWTITEDQFVVHLKEVCRYCQGQLNETGSAYDRIDPNGGYWVENVVPCCTACNLYRGLRLSYEDMLLAGPHLREARLAIENGRSCRLSA